MSSFFGLIPCSVLLATTGTLSPPIQDQQPEAPAIAQDKRSADELEQERIHKAFSEKLSGCTLVGRFTIDGRAETPAAPERYEIASVTHFRDDLWVFTARIKYGQTDVKLPITIKVLWAGDTPVITMDKMTIPGMGTFSCRVLFHGDRYVGTWQHDAVGGHMYGAIEPAAKQGATAETNGD